MPHSLHGIRPRVPHMIAGDRPGVKNYGIIITDGVSTVHHATAEPEANRAKQAGQFHQWSITDAYWTMIPMRCLLNHCFLYWTGIELFVIQVTGSKDPDTKALSTIADEDHIFPVGSDDEVSDAITAITSRICEWCSGVGQNMEMSWESLKWLMTAVLMSDSVHI